MKTRILIVSYAADLPYLRYNLRSIYKFTHDFDGLTLVVPEAEKASFEPMVAEYPCDIRAYERSPNPATWHLEAQCRKCYADLYCADADFVLHTDSDCMFTEPVGPEDYFVNGKPVMLIEPFSRLPGTPWKKVTEEVLRCPVEFETMRRHPQVNPVGVYVDLRRHIEGLHQMTFSDYVQSRKPDFPWGFTEHNVIGAFAHASPKWHPAYHWIDLAKERPPKQKLMQFWSLSPPDRPQRSPNSMQQLQCIPREMAERILR